MAKEIIKEDGSYDKDALDEAITTAYEDLHDPLPEKTEDKLPGGEEKLASDEPVVPDEEDESGENDDWMLADDVRELVESLGLSEEDVKEFSGVDELNRHAKFLDKQFREEGRKVRPGEEQEKALEAQDDAEKRMKLQQRAEKQSRDEDGKFKSESDDVYKPSLDKDVFDEEIVKEFEKMNEFYGSRIQKLEAMLQQQAAQEDESFHRAQVQAFDSIVDALGHEDLFGKSDELRPKSSQWEERVRLWEAMNEVMAGIERMRGVTPEVSPAIVKRALRQEFAKELETKQRKSFTEKIQKQSQRRLGGGRMRVDSERPYEGPPERDPFLLKAFQQFEKENGAA